MIRFRLFATALSILGAALGCSAVSPDSAQTEDEIVDPSNSNIRSPEIGRVTQLKLLPNTNVPRAVMVGLINSEASIKFVADLHEHIMSVNAAEGLTGEGGYQQQINLIVASTSWTYERALSTIRARRGLGRNEPVPLINLVEDVIDNDVWLQDFGEFAAVQGVNDPGRTWYGLLDAGRYRGINVQQIGNILGLSITKVPAPESGGTYGGNTEATPEGKLYIGDSAPAQYISGLKNLGNPDAVVIPSNWLMVGHVDEYVTVLPARNACNSALLVSSGLEALNMARRAPGEFASVVRGVGEAMDEYAVRRRGPNEDYVLSDFDTSRQPSTSAGLFVRQNLIAESFALDAIDKLQSASCVGDVIRLPQLFKTLNGKAVAATPGAVNSLILRNHAIVPDPMINSLRQVVRERYARALMNEENVHLIDDTLYHQGHGEVHCGTNVIRELSMPYRL